MEKIHVRNFIDNSLIFNISIVNDKLIHIYFIATRSLFVIHVYISTPLKHQIHQNYRSTVKSTIFKEEEGKEE